jgi:hypothetical protein
LQRLRGCRHPAGEQTLNKGMNVPITRYNFQNNEYCDLNIRFYKRRAIFYGSMIESLNVSVL